MTTYGCAKTSPAIYKSRRPDKTVFASKMVFNNQRIKPCWRAFPRESRQHGLKFLSLDYPLHATTVVVCYLYPGAMEKLKVKFEKELGP